MCVMKNVVLEQVLLQVFWFAPSSHFTNSVMSLPIRCAVGLSG
jgi:hypothetical protein